MRSSIFLVVPVAVAASACGLSLDRVLGLPPGTVRGSTEPNARVDVVGSSVTRRADGDGNFVVAGLGAGTVRFRITKDDDGDGAPERGAVQDVFLGDKGGEALGVDLGAVALVATGAIRGRVIDGAAARVVVARGGLEPGADGDVLSAAEQETGADATGAFRLRGVVAGDVIVVAAKDGSVSAANDVVVAPGAEASPADIALVAADEFDVALVIDGDDSGLVVSVGADDDTPTPLADFTGLPAGVGYDLRLSAPDGRNGQLFSQLVPNGPAPAVRWGVAIVDVGDPCERDGVRDCDGDGAAGLPVLAGSDDPDVQTWRACDASCSAFGDGDASCRLGEAVFDCDDDNDGQPDVTEPAACLGIGKGTDLDADFLCSVVDPFPDCKDNAADVCVPVEDTDVFVPPPPLADPFTPPVVVDDPCGDGDLDDGEACDDGNTVDGDGCEGDCAYACDAPGDVSVGGPVAVVVTADGRCAARFAEALSWRAANDACRAAGGNLVTDDDAAVAALGDALWIGLTDAAREGAFRWQSAAAFDAVVDDQFTVAPDDAGDGEDCVARVDGGWVDEACDGVAREFACEFGAPPRNGDGLVNGDEDCDDGDDDSGDGCDSDGTFPCAIGALPAVAAVLLPDDRCQVLLDERLDVDAANARCAAAGATLPQLFTGTENAAWARLIGDRDAWLGLSSNGDDVRWPDGSFPEGLQNFEGGSAPDADSHVWFSRPHGHGWSIADAGEAHAVVCEAATGDYNAVCGDGIKDGDEGCDDGNDVEGDGCSGCVIDCGVASGGGFRDAHGLCVGLFFGVDSDCPGELLRWEPLDLADLKALDDRLPPFTRIAGSNVKRPPDDFGVDFTRFAPGEPDGFDFDVEFASALALDRGFMRDVDGSIVAPLACVFPPPVCGNATQEEGEACDDGNLVSGDGCDADCTLPCPAGPDGVASVRVGDKCLFLLTNSAPAATQQGLCSDAGGRLFEPESLEEHRAAARLAVVGRTFEINPVLIGLTDAAEERNFVGSSSGVAPAINVFSGLRNESDDDLFDCVGVRDGGWVDTDCLFLATAICEVDVAAGADDCGNGVVEGDEDCDDGNDVNGDGCEAGCTFACGGALPFVTRARVVLPTSDRCAVLYDDTRQPWTASMSRCRTDELPDDAPFKAADLAEMQSVLLPVLDETGPAFVGITNLFFGPGSPSWEDQSAINFSLNDVPVLSDPQVPQEGFYAVRDGLRAVTAFTDDEAVWCTVPR